MQRKGAEMREVLKRLYGDAVTEESLDTFGEELGKRFVPKAEFNLRGDELKALKEENAELLKELERSRAAAATAETEKGELEARGAAYVAEIEGLKQRETELTVNGLIDRALMQEKARNLTAVKALLNMEGISLKDGELCGFADQLCKLKEECGYLFESKGGALQFMRPAAQSHLEMTPETFKQMSYMERLQMKREQPSLYSALVKAGKR